MCPDRCWDLAACGGGPRAIAESGVEETGASAEAGTEG